MSLIDADLERTILTQLADAGPSATLCASCLVAVVKVNRHRAMAAVRQLMIRSLVDVGIHRCARCAEIGLAVRRPPSH